MKQRPEMLRKMVLYIVEHSVAPLKIIGGIISNDYIKTPLIAGNYYYNTISSQVHYKNEKVQRLTKEYLL